MPPLLRLLHTNDYKLIVSDRNKKDPEKYAIFSHTWLHPAKSEVTYHDMTHDFEAIKNGRHKIKEKQVGWWKLTEFCKFAARQGFQWVWIDTCCINKKDDKEREISIHGMYEFYENAVLCYAYLADVKYSPNPTEQLNNLKQSRWFTRGWTLQELIAPRSLVYLSRDWKSMGYREQFLDIPDLGDILQRSSPISYRSFSSGGSEDTPKYNLATMLSWSAERETTEPEDRTYSLCGLFHVRVPVKYKTRQDPFFLFQKELIGKYQDLSLLAWMSTTDSIERYRKFHEGRDPPKLNLLAPSVEFFSKVPSGWDTSSGRFSDDSINSGRTPVLQGHGPNLFLSIDSDYVSVVTKMFELETMTRPSNSKTTESTIVLQLMQNNNGYKAGMIAIKTLSQGKAKWQRTFQNYGLFFFQWHPKDETCHGFLDLEWPSSSSQFSKPKQVRNAKYLGIQKALFRP